MFACTDVMEPAQHLIFRGYFFDMVGGQGKEEGDMFVGDKNGDYMRK